MSLFSAPYGGLHPFTIEAAREAGYDKAVTCDPRVMRCDDSPLMIGRFKKAPEDWTIEFRLKAAGAYAWRGWFRRRGMESIQLSNQPMGAVVPSSRQVRA
ncbi:MAG: hypothetical protein HY287_02910 [Planctomycetes bacterium]|nr:hypothetical protein [Planctomycetota bacterium]MBI3833261.1 hypothetical protein [Planctomycetota bacterium]